MIDEVNSLNLPAYAIVDRSFFKKTNNKFEHKFVYLSVTNSTTGKTWLNNNLGAEYANKNSSDYNPSQQATTSSDYRAYGSMFQWGRKADGHELMNWRDNTHGTGRYGTTKTQNDNPKNLLFITPDFDIYNSKYTWRVHPDSNLWKGVDSPNNPCPMGYRVPTHDQTQPAGANNEWLEEGVTWKSEDYVGAYDSKLKLTLSGWRDPNNNIEYANMFGDYWSASMTSDGFIYIFGNIPSNYHETYWNKNRASLAVGQAVRCIKN